jgi:predicted glycosyltransferase
VSIPSVVLLELFPFGRHALAFELGPLLVSAAQDRVQRGAAAPARRGEPPRRAREQAEPAWFELASVAVARQWTDRILVHGSPDVIPLERTHALAEWLGDASSTRGTSAPTARRRPARPTERS